MKGKESESDINYVLLFLFSFFLPSLIITYTTLYSVRVQNHFYIDFKVALTTWVMVPGTTPRGFLTCILFVGVILCFIKPKIESRSETQKKKR